MSALSNFPGRGRAQALRLTGSDDFPVSALADADFGVQVDLYPAAVSLVAEGDLSKDQRENIDSKQKPFTRQGLKMQVCEGGTAQLSR